MRIEKGYSLVELLISTFLGILVIGTITSAYTMTLTGSNQYLKESALSSELDSILFLMASEIKRAGYCRDCFATNPFMLNDGTNSANILIDGLADSSNGHCILFAYNHDSALGVTSIRNDDARGFRVKDSNKDGRNEIEIYTTYSGMANWSCTGTNWQDYNNKRIDIKKLDFTRTVYDSSVAGSTNSIQNITITIGGKLGELYEERTTSVALPNIKP